MFNAGLAFLAGVLGGAVMSALLYLAQAAGLSEMTLAMLLGTMFTQQVSGGAWLLGLLLVLVIGGLIGLLYGLILDAWRPAVWWHGLLIGIPHAVLTGLFLWMVPFIHPAVPGLLPPPGFLAINLGAATALSMLVVHLVYGAVVGGVYHPRTRAERVTRARPAHA